MSTTTQTVVVEPGGHLKLEGKTGQTTAIEVKAPDIPKPADPTGTVAIAAVATLTAAAVGQLLAHYLAAHRDRKAKLRDALDLALDRALDAANALDQLGTAFRAHAAGGPKPTDAIRTFADRGRDSASARLRYGSRPGVDKGVEDGLIALGHTLRAAYKIRPAFGNPPELEAAADDVQELANRIRLQIDNVAQLDAHT